MRRLFRPILATRRRPREVPLRLAAVGAMQQLAAAHLAPPVGHAPELAARPSWRRIDLDSDPDPAWLLQADPPVGIAANSRVRVPLIWPKNLAQMVRGLIIGQPPEGRQLKRRTAGLAWPRYADMQNCRWAVPLRVGRFKPAGRTS